MSRMVTYLGGKKMQTMYVRYDTENTLQTQIRPYIII